MSLKIKGLKLNKDTNWSDKLGLLICLSACFVYLTAKLHNVTHITTLRGKVKMSGKKSQ